MDGDGMTGPAEVGRPAGWVHPFPPRRDWGLPSWTAVLLALLCTLAGTLVDLWLGSQPGRFFQAGYVVGCVLAVCVVRRRSLLAPMVQPPLVMVSMVPLAIVLDAAWPPGGIITHLMAAIMPVFTNFTVQASVTVATVVLGLIRIILHRRPADRTA